MSKKSPFRGHFDKQHGKGGQTLLKPETHHLYHIYWSLSRRLSWKKYLLVICKVLGMFVNILTADDKCFLLNRDNLRHPIQMQLSDKQKKIINFFRIFWNLNEILNILKKRTKLIADLFSKLRTLKTFLNKCLKSPVSETFGQASW